MKQCSTIGCKNMTDLIDDVETSPGVIEKRPVCSEHTGTLIGNVAMESTFILPEATN